MKDDKDTSADAVELRRRAEQKLKAAGTEVPPPILIPDALRLVHELQVHQIELEMQNEELRRARVDADAWLEWYTDLYDFAPVGYFTLDRHGSIRQVNLTGSSLVGMERSRLIDERFARMVSRESLPAFNAFLESVFESQTKQICELVLLTGTRATVYVRMDAAIPKDGKVCRVAVIDVTERKRVEEELAQSKAETESLNRKLQDALLDSNQYAISLETAKGEIEEHAVVLGHQANHDALTGLPNRHYFERHLNELITGSLGRKPRSIAVLFSDLDKFKMINDTMGHKVGDLLLVEVADRLQSCLRSEDLLARMGGDEFTVILPRCNRRSIAQTVASRMIDSISRPFEIQGHRLVIGATIGLASYPSDGTDTVTLLKHADAAMYKAKQAARGTFCWFTGDVDIDNQQRADMEMDLRAALEKGQFDVHYQPIVSLHDGSILAAEALLRWEHPEKGMISPSLFIPIAEEIDMIGQIGDYVLRKACSQTVAWRDAGMQLSQIGVNVSTAQVRDAGWLDSVSAVLSDTGIDARCLNLEVTETDFAADHESMKETLRKVQELGVCMAIDDFGTGQSSLSRLRDFPVIHLKIDGSFVKDIEHNKNDNALVRSIIEMAHGQGIKVTAEWVETESQMEILRSIGCDFAQGYFISPALPAEAFGDFIRS